jgi:LmbE family N-acetylglucosaminyl deacetylase
MIGQVRTVVAFHAHPDDEALLTGGTLAKLAAEGHRVVIVVATDGSMGAAADRRLAELRASAATLGAARIAHLGYADSGYGPVLFPDPPGRVRFARADVDEAAARLAGIIREEHAALLLSYDVGGGYGHRDHVKVHQVGARAAQLAGNVRVLEVTWPQEFYTWMYMAAWLSGLVVRHRPRAARMAGTPRAEITHRVNVRRYAAQKQAALAAHSSQYSGSSRAARLMHLLIRLPVPAFALLLGYEWFVEAAPGRCPPRTPLLTGSKTLPASDSSSRRWPVRPGGRPPRTTSSE